MKTLGPENVQIVSAHGRGRLHSRSVQHWVRNRSFDLFSNTTSFCAFYLYCTCATIYTDPKISTNMGQISWIQVAFGEN